jgi:hypothetical protein
MDDLEIKIALTCRETQRIWDTGRRKALSRELDGRLQMLFSALIAASGRHGSVAPRG